MKKSLLWMLVAVNPVLHASVAEILPTWHWAYAYIEDAQIEGLLSGLYEMNQPYTRGDIARALIEAGSRIKQNKIMLTPALVERYKRLAQEFSGEILSLQGKADSLQTVIPGLWLIEEVTDGSEADTKVKGIYRTRIHVPVSDHVSLYNGIVFDQYLVDDPNYIGKEWRGIAGYTEQAYANVHYGRYRVKFGRDFLKWGAGQKGTLLFSNIAEPMDQFLGSVDLGPLRFSYVFARLNDQFVPDRQAWARRYISGHRLDAHFLDGRLQCAISELVVYGGVNRIPDMSFLNPFEFYHGAQMNENNTANTIGSIDLLVYPVPFLQFYASLMIDDIQVEKTGPVDLEPNELGLVTGTKWSPADGTILGAEYARVTNRTYKTLNPWETFAHRGTTLGHPLGNDFDMLQFSLRQWIGASFRAELDYEMIRKGEGSLFTPFDMPWMQYTVKEGYSEPFPTGVIEKTGAFQIRLDYFASEHWGVYGEFQSLKIDNARHGEGESKSLTQFRIGVRVNGDLPIVLK